MIAYLQNWAFYLIVYLLFTFLPISFTAAASSSSAAAVVVFVGSSFFSVHIIGGHQDYYRAPERIKKAPKVTRSEPKGGNFNYVQ